MDEASGLPSPEELKPLLRKLWPNRTHESNWVKDVACRLGLHRWSYGKNIHAARW
jgi:hypothetical protein